MCIMYITCIYYKNIPRNIHIYSYTYIFLEIFYKMFHNIIYSHYYLINIQLFFVLQTRLIINVNIALKIPPYN